MAAGFHISCSNCSFTIDAWDDGNPYIVNHAGERENFYHPDEADVIEKVRAFISSTDPDTLHKDAGRMGNEYDLLCLDCGHTCRLDPDVDTITCAKCGGATLQDYMSLEGGKCPKCRKGTLRGDDGPMMVS